MRELFRHRERFVASIAIARVPRRRLGERIRIGELSHELDAEDLAAHDALADRLYPRVAPDGDWLSISLRGHDYPSRQRCPALSDEGRCSLHATGKPAICEAVPLDPLAPDRLQAFVLGARREQAEWIGAGCLVEPGEPALLAIARISSRCRAASIEVLDGQQRLIASMVEAALARRLPEDRATTRELRAHAEACGKARRELASTGAALASPAIDSAAVEAWLGLA